LDLIGNSLTHLIENLLSTAHTDKWQGEDKQSVLPLGVLLQ